jgi:hypothetical protein
VPASIPSIDVIDRRSRAPNRANISPVDDQVSDDPDTPDDEIEDVDENDEDIDDDSAGEALITEDTDHVTYDVSEWAGESRTMLDSLLSGDDIPHFWQGTQLTVPVGNEERVDELIDEVLASANPALDADRDKVVYEVGGWSAALQSGLAESLGVADIPYEWSESGDLLVYAEDEERVDDILDAMPDPDDEELADADGLDVQDVLSKLFLAAGTLRRSPTDSDAVIDAVDAANRLEHMSVPFGFEPPSWRSIVEEGVALREMLEGGDGGDDEDDGGDAGGDAGAGATDEEVMEQAARIRTRLRPLV